MAFANDALNVLLVEEHEDGFVDDEELLLLQQGLGFSKKQNPEFPYWNHPKFDLNNWNDDECWADFRFRKADLNRLLTAFGLPGEMQTINRLKVSSLEALCILLRRLAFPCRYSDLIPRFGRSVPDLCVICNHVLNLLYTNFNHLLTSFNQEWLSRDNLQYYADCIHEKGAPLDFCWGFIDGTLRPVCRPETGQRLLYSGHKRVHGFKFQSVVAPNGLVANFFGPVEGSRHDSYMLALSGLLRTLEQHSFRADGSALCIYGDPAYPLSVHIQNAFKNPASAEEDAFNTAMSSVRVSVEWVFGDILERFRFTDFKKMMKVGLRAIICKNQASGDTDVFKFCPY